MLRVEVSLVEISRTRNYRTYELIYNGEPYRLLVYFGEKFCNKLWECEKEIPEEVAPFVTRILTKEVSEFKARVGEITDVFEDWILEARQKKRIPEDLELNENDMKELEKHVIDMIYNYK